jgi:hypothetical protein
MSTNPQYPHFLRVQALSTVKLKVKDIPSNDNSNTDWLLATLKPRLSDIVADKALETSRTVTLLTPTASRRGRLAQRPLCWQVTRLLPSSTTGAFNYTACWVILKIPFCPIFPLRN